MDVTKGEIQAKDLELKVLGNIVTSDQKSLKSKNVIFVFLHFTINFSAVFHMKKALCPYLLWKAVFESPMSM